MNIKGKTAWDCVKIETALNTSKIDYDEEYATTFLTYDNYIKKATVSRYSDLMPDTSFAESDPSRSWVSVPSKSSKECSQMMNRNGIDVVKCKEVDAHFHREFYTDSAD